MTPGNRQQCSGAKSSRIKFSCEDERNVVAVANPFLEGVFYLPDWRELNLELGRIIWNFVLK